MKIWQCYDNLPAQAWYYTDDERIALTGQGKLAGRLVRLFQLLLRLDHFRRINYIKMLRSMSRRPQWRIYQRISSTDVEMHG